MGDLATRNHLLRFFEERTTAESLGALDEVKLRRDGVAKGTRYA
jgi:hypothetical protein